MNFNEEIESELQELGFGGCVIDVQQSDKGTPKDWANLERRIALRVYENEITMVQSELNASRPVLC